MAFLRGKWIVRCVNGHDDEVDGITKNHDCDTCDKKSVDNGTANVVCPNGHASPVGGITESHICPECDLQCRR